jgi:LTXXQ motif family protein
MVFVSARATRTAVMVIALSAAGLWALHAMDARADPPALDDNSPCAEGRALFAAKLAYLEARIAPEPSQEGAWRQFTDAMRISAGDADRACVEEPPRPLSVDAGERLKRMDKHAAAMQAMFGAMANAYEAIVPNLTAPQRDILSRNLVPPPFPPGRSAPHAGNIALTCGQGAAGFHGWAPPWEAPPL